MLYDVSVILDSFIRLVVYTSETLQNILFLSIMFKGILQEWGDAMNIDILSTNIKRYRTRKNITQQGLSDLSGISLPAIKNIERKKSLPRTNTLLDLSKALDCRLQDLVMPVKELSSVRFRAKKKMNRREQVLAQVSKWLNNFSFLEELLSENEEYKFQKLVKPPRKRTPAQLAEEARNILKLKDDEPIHDISGLIESCGIKLLAFPYSSDAFNGLSVAVDDKGPAQHLGADQRGAADLQCRT